ncbi:hypothetical protein R6Q57_024998 [Mikania cordata]
MGMGSLNCVNWSRRTTVVDDFFVSSNGKLKLRHALCQIYHQGKTFISVRSGISFVQFIAEFSIRCSKLAIANISLNLAFTKSVAGSGCITVLASLAISMNRLIIVTKGAIAKAGVIRDLVDLILKWSRGGDRVLKRAAGALTNLTADDKCSMEIAAVGGTSALVTLACKCKHDGVQRYDIFLQ